jgi:hypothetical protein
MTALYEQAYMKLLAQRARGASVAEMRLDPSFGVVASPPRSAANPVSTARIADLRTARRSRSLGGDKSRPHVTFSGSGSKPAS